MDAPREALFSHSKPATAGDRGADRQALAWVAQLATWLNLDCNLWSEKVMAKAAALAGFSHADLLEMILAEAWLRHGLIAA